MYINWKALCSLGFTFWGLMCATDLLGDSTWKKCSPHVDDILKDQYQKLVKMNHDGRDENDSLRVRTNWPTLLWNTCLFLCTLLFCSVLKSISWFFWRLFKIYNIFKKGKIITNRNPIEESSSSKPNCKILFKNQMFINSQQEPMSLCKELEELKKEKIDLSEQLMVAKKENMTARQQIEEYKLETLMMKEKLARTADSLKENLKYKDFANANHEIIARKAHSLEFHLKEVSRDRDLLRNKLNNMEKSYSKLAERLNHFDKEKNEAFSVQMPEKDNTQDESRGDADFQKKRVIWDNDSNKNELESNSKISVDLEDSSKENEEGGENEYKKAHIDAIKKNILNYSAYKAQMLKPRFKLTNFQHLHTSTDTTGSSSDDNGTSCHRIISSTVEFQNFLKTLNSADSVNYNDKNFS